ncbi:MAG: GNAT family N-acetyltransferase [Chloroflexi bacterium]|nr:GNAT family N-acetyltransferase [Chloroflexota bacterium]
MGKFIVRHAYAHEFARIGDLVLSTFFGQGTPVYERELRFWTLTLPGAPGFDYSAYRVGVLDNGAGEQIVAHAAVRPYTLRYGSVDLRIYGVGAVCTHPDYRQRGYAAAVLHDALAYMAEQGAHLALLNGVRGYYGRFGFNPVWPDYVFSIDAAEAARLPQTLSLRPAALVDAPALAALYHQHWGARVAFTRSADLWRWRLGEQRRDMLLVAEDAGQIAGYVRASEQNALLTEVVANSGDAALTLLADAGARYQRAGIARVEWLLPPDDALVYYARLALPVTVSAAYSPDGGWMARLIHSEALVRALLPEIAAQAHSTMPEFDPAALQFVCQPDGVQIGLDGQPETFAQLNHQDFIQVLFGSLRPAALALRPDSGLRRAAVRLLEALFPPRMAALAPWDWF